MNTVYKVDMFAGVLNENLWKNKNITNRCKKKNYQSR